MAQIPYLLVGNKLDICKVGPLNVHSSCGPYDWHLVHRECSLCYIWATLHRGAFAPFTFNPLHDPTLMSISAYFLPSSDT